MKRLSRTLILLGMSTVLSINTLAFNFKDVPSNHWAYTSASYMQQKGYMTVNSSGEFFPNTKVGYFEIAEILAKATGYQDENVVKDMDPAFKASIQANYNKQLPYIKAYDTKYTGWVTRTNEEIAYLLGRGYLTYEDLGKFMVKASSGQEVKRVLNKEDLAVFLVRALAKEETAKKEYKTTGFKDEAKIKAENRPHVAYLVKLGLISGDKNGNFGPATEVTRGVCAKMTSDVLQYKEKLEAASKPTTGTPTATVNSKQVTLNKIMDKNETEYYILGEYNGATSFYTMKKDAPVYDKNDKKLTMKEVTVGSKATIFIEQKNGTDYINKLYLGQAGTGETDTDTSNQETTLERTSVEGTIDRIGRNDDLSLVTKDKVTTYTFGKDCIIISDGKVIDKEALQVDDTIKAYVQGDVILRIDLLKQKETNTSEKAEFVRAIVKQDNYLITVKEGQKDKEITVSKDVDLIRNDKRVDIQRLKIGDKMVFDFKNGEVIGVEITAEEDTLQGSVKAILLGIDPKITIQTKEGMEDFAITQNTEIYNADQRKYISLKDVSIGARVEVDLESKEVVRLTVQKVPENFSYKGTIEGIEKGVQYINVLVEYDALTGETMVEKRIKVGIDTTIKIDGRETHKGMLKEGMEVLAVFDYNEELEPEYIIVIGK